jgi:preprotein translocase subunit SecG
VAIIQIILQVFQVLSALSVITLVLLHSPKGEGFGAIGGAAQLFSSQKGAEATLNKITTWAVAIFFVVSFILGYYFNHAPV